MIHPDTEVRFIDKEKGYGLFATAPIPLGTITWCLDRLDREITPAEMDTMEPLYRDILMQYSFRNNKGNYIFCWDNTRYINHSYQANSYQTAYNFEIAVRDIETGEEITNDYGFLNIIEPFEVESAGEERNVVYPDDLLRYAERWDEKIAAAMRMLLLVRQPLQVYLPPGMWQTIHDINRGRVAMKSIKSNYYQDTALHC